MNLCESVPAHSSATAWMKGWLGDSCSRGRDGQVRDLGLELARRLLGAGTYQVGRAAGWTPGDIRSQRRSLAQCGQVKESFLEEGTSALNS